MGLERRLPDDVVICAPRYRGITWHGVPCKKFFDEYPDVANCISVRRHLPTPDRVQPRRDPREKVHPYVALVSGVYTVFYIGGTGRRRSVA